ncbi:hypothetical protein EJ110_NYTH09475 [Nymphaea thermarum]|nr:hypothetical protein EJ110_NYTH09475 [Nymphaea thermarum]
MLRGLIPQSPQFSTFDAWSFEGNPSLGGSPLWLPCEANKSTTSIPFLGPSRASKERTWKYSLFLNKGKGLVAFGEAAIGPVLLEKLQDHEGM